MAKQNEVEKCMRNVMLITSPLDEIDKRIETFAWITGQDPEKVKEEADYASLLDMAISGLVKPD